MLLSGGLAVLYSKCAVAKRKEPHALLAAPECEQLHYPGLFKGQGEKIPYRNVAVVIGRLLKESTESSGFMIRSWL